MATVSVRERMRPGTIAVAWHDSAEDAFGRMRAAGLEAIPVTSNQQVIGLVEREAASACRRSGNWLASVPVASLMRRGGFSCGTTDSLDRALALMDQLDTELLAVMDETGQVAGVIGRDQAMDLAPVRLAAAALR